MRKIIFLLIFCIILTTGSFDAAVHPDEILTEEEALITSFESTGADVLESTISCWKKMNCEFLTIKQIEAEMKKIVDIIKPESSGIIKNVESDEYINKIVLYAFKENKTYSIAIESVKQGELGETYVVIDVSIDKSYEDLPCERKRIADALKGDQGLISFNSCIIGTYKGKMSEREADKKSKTALQSIKARKVEGIEDEELKSISAFSNNVKGYVLSDQARVNIQLAMRYSSYDDKTYIWIGTPLISMGY